MANNLLTLIENRHSGRSYDPNRDVSDENLELIQKAATYAPSCYGEEPWRYIICSKSKNPTEWQKVYESLAEPNQKWAKDVNILIIGTCQNKFALNNKINKWASHDLGAASMSMALMAESLEIMLHQMGGFDEDKLAENFNLSSEEQSILTVIALGYEMKAEREIYLTKEQKKERKPLSEIYPTPKPFV